MRKMKKVRRKLFLNSLLKFLDFSEPRDTLIFVCLTLKMHYVKAMMTKTEPRHSRDQQTKMDWNG